MLFLLLVSQFLISELIRRFIIIIIILVITFMQGIYN